MRWAVVVVSIGMMAGAVIPRSGVLRDRQEARDDRAMTELFVERVNAYVALHRELEQLLPPEIITSDPRDLFAPRLAMSREMRQARRRVQQGNIFTPALEAYFRKLVADTLRREGIVDFMAIVEDENTVRVPAKVNGDYPAGRSVPAIPPSLLAAFPALPPEVRYSFIGRDLILWDLHAGLIVDFVARAIPEMTELEERE